MNKNSYSHSKNGCIFLTGLNTFKKRLAMARSAIVMMFVLIILPGDSRGLITINTLPEIWDILLPL